MVVIKGRRPDYSVDEADDSDEDTDDEEESNANSSVSALDGTSYTSADKVSVMVRRFDPKRRSFALHCLSSHVLCLNSTFLLTPPIPSFPR